MCEEDRIVRLMYNKRLLRFIYIERKRMLLSLLLLNVNIKGPFTLYLCNNRKRISSLIFDAFLC